jgi:hypothetical protein
MPFRMRRQQRLREMPQRIRAVLLHVIHTRSTNDLAVRPPQTTHGLSNDLWQLKLHYDRSDTSCDHLFASASELLRWWTANRDAVAAAAFTAAD